MNGVLSSFVFRQTFLEDKTKTIMAPMLPEELSLTLLEQVPCRALQIRELLALLSVRLLVHLFNPC